MDLGLKGLTAVVTGGSGGIGGMGVEAVSSEGCNVAFCGRSQERVGAMLACLAKRPVKSSGKVIDATDSAGVAAFSGRSEGSIFSFRGSARYRLALPTH